MQLRGNACEKEAIKQDFLENVIKIVGVYTS